MQIASQTALSVTTSAVSAAAALYSPETFTVQWLGVPLPVLLASFAGATCALSFLTTMGFMRCAVALAVSTVAASYCVPLLSWAIGVPEKLSIGLAFMIALFGQTLIGSAFGSIPEAIKQVFSALADRIRGRP